MSWFDTANFATLAKTALKEAQKTIDKALDIKEEEINSQLKKIEKTQSENTLSDIGKSTSDNATGVDNKKMTASLWGSFTGSFFENPKGLKSPIDSSSANADFILDQPKKSVPIKSVSLDLPLVSYTELNKPSDTEVSNLDPETEKMKEVIKNFPTVDIVYRKKDSKVVNRLSVISSESDRRSTDSCEVLGSHTPSSEYSDRQSGSFEESVEVITSPSSVDVLGSVSPQDQKNSSDSISPIAEGEFEDSRVFAIPQDDDESISVEDSCTSASDMTLTVATVLTNTNNIMLKSTSSLDTSFSETLSPRDTLNRVNVITTAPRPSSREDILNVLKSGNEVHAEEINQSRLSSISAGSCEGSCDTLMEEEQSKIVEIQKFTDYQLKTDESGDCESESNEISESKSDSTGGVIRHMILEAMEETLQQSNINRETSPISSEKSDLVKINSSDHNSADELETTTSSDIEVISSPTPNGSSTASRQSPAKIVLRNLNLGKMVTSRIKGHHREPSEASSGGSDEGSEVDRLLKRIAEMTEILDARESKVIDLSRMNATLQESNNELKCQLERQTESQHAKILSEEFTQRIADLERKLQQANRVKESLKKMLEQTKSQAEEKLDDIEKDQLILELRNEGEILSKQQLILNNTIKKLRSTEKENSKTINNLKEQLSDLSQELERSKKAVNCKEEMERSHIEAVHNLTKQKQQFEKEISVLKTDLAGLTSTLVSTQKELIEKENKIKEMEAKRGSERADLESKLRVQLTAELEGAQRQTVTLQSALEDMRAQLVWTQQTNSQSENELRREINELMKRLEASERRIEEQTELVSTAAQPLHKQLKDLTESQNTAEIVWQRREALLNRKISEYESKLSNVQESERSIRSQYEDVSSQLASMQDRMLAISNRCDFLKRELTSSKEIVENLTKEKIEFQKFEYLAKAEMEIEIDNFKHEVTSLTDLLNMEKAALEAEKQKTLNLQEQLMNLKHRSSPILDSSSPRSSPTLSFGRISMTDSVNSVAWPTTSIHDDVFESSTTSGKYFDILKPSNNTSYIENLQALLKLKEGEIQQLQWDKERRENEKSNLRNAVAELTIKLDKANGQLSELSELRPRYDALLVIYGEKLEETQELKMDLADVKEMYKAQINELLKKIPGPQPPPS